MSNFDFAKLRVCDALGNGLVGAKLYFYEVGTTTPKDTYQDYDLATPNTNPVVTDANGFTPPVFLAADGYKIVATDADDVALAGYSCDEYWPSRPESSGKISATSGDSDPALLGTNTSSGPGVKAVSSGTGHALWVEGDTSSPIKAALHVVGQDALPSSPAIGDIYVSSLHGRLATYDGADHFRIGGSRRGNCYLDCDTSPAQEVAGGVYAIKANCWDQSTTMDLTIMVGCLVASDATSVTLILRCGGNDLLSLTITPPSTGELIHIKMLATIAVPGASADVYHGSQILLPPAASGAVDGIGSHGVVTVDTTAEVKLGLYAYRTGGTQCYLLGNVRCELV